MSLSPRDAIDNDPHGGLWSCTQLWGLSSFNPYLSLHPGGCRPAAQFLFSEERTPMNVRRFVCALAALVLAATTATLMSPPLAAQFPGGPGSSSPSVAVSTLSTTVHGSTSESGTVAAIRSGAASNARMDGSAWNDRDLLVRDRLALASAFQGPTTPSCGGVCFNSGMCSTVGQACTTSGRAGTCQYTSLTKCICGCK